VVTASEKGDKFVFLEATAKKLGDRSTKGRPRFNAQGTVSRHGVCVHMSCLCVVFQLCSNGRGRTSEAGSPQRRRHTSTRRPAAGAQ